MARGSPQKEKFPGPSGGISDDKLEGLLDAVDAQLAGTSSDATSLTSTQSVADPELEAIKLEAAWMFPYIMISQIFVCTSARAVHRLRPASGTAHPLSTPLPIAWPSPLPPCPRAPPCSHGERGAAGGAEHGQGGIPDVLHHARPARWCGLPHNCHRRPDVLSACPPRPAPNERPSACEGAAAASKSIRGTTRGTSNGDARAANPCVQARPSACSPSVKSSERQQHLSQRQRRRRRLRSRRRAEAGPEVPPPPL